MEPKVAVHATDESYVFGMPRAGIELTIATGDSKVTVALDFSEASDLALALQHAVRSTATAGAV